MLLPNFSIRALLGVTGAVAIVALLIQLALRGHSWAGGLAAAILAAIISMLVGAAVFLGFELLGPLGNRNQPRTAPLAQPPRALPTSASNKATDEPSRDEKNIP